MYISADIQPRSPSSGHRVLDIRRVTPRITVNTAGAQVIVLTCQIGSTGSGIGFTSDTSPCAQIKAFHAGRVDIGFPVTEIIYNVIAAHVGTIRIEGAEVA